MNCVCGGIDCNNYTGFNPITGKYEKHYRLGTSTTMPYEEWKETTWEVVPDHRIYLDSCTGVTISPYYSGATYCNTGSGKTFIQYTYLTNTSTSTTMNGTLTVTYAGDSIIEDKPRRLKAFQGHVCGTLKFEKK